MPVHSSCAIFDLKTEDISKKRVTICHIPILIYVLRYLIFRAAPDYETAVMSKFHDYSSFISQSQHNLSPPSQPSHSQQCLTQPNLYEPQLAAPPPGYPGYTAQHQVSQHNLYVGYPLQNNHTYSTPELNNTHAGK